MRFDDSMTVKLCPTQLLDISHC